MPAASGWRPAIDRARLRQRAAVIAAIRDFFATRDVVEVETPVLSRYGTTDPAIESFTTRYEPPGGGAETLYLQTSPEFFMKRLLAAGSGPIYQLGRVFRNGEAGRRHNPEFTLLEWYRPGFTLEDLMDEVTALVASLLPEPPARLDYRYREAFERFAGVDPFVADTASLLDAVSDHGLDCPLSEADGHDACLDFMLSHIVEPALPRDSLVFIYDFPATQASLARIEPGSPAVARRFEAWLGGRELANGFEELDDPDEQRRRFEHDNRLRRQRGQAQIPPDDCLLDALAAGLPECSGVALGVERLLMHLFGVDDIRQTMAFAWHPDCT